MNGRELEKRVHAIRNTGKTTRAMEMIASSKLSSLQVKSLESTRYMEALFSMLDLLQASREVRHPFLDGHEKGQAALIVIAGDKGLCGDYNTAILATADRFLEKTKIDRILAVGYIAMEHYRRRGYQMDNYYVHLQEPHAFDAIMLADDMLKRYLDERFDEVYIAYTKTITATRHEPRVDRLLPIVSPNPPLPYRECIMEPDDDASLTNFLSQIVMSELYSALADSAHAQNLSRMLAMRKSTENGEQMIKDLTLCYHRKRQESITGEMLNKGGDAE